MLHGPYTLGARSYDVHTVAGCRDLCMQSSELCCVVDCISQGVCICFAMQRGKRTYVPRPSSPTVQQECVQAVPDQGLVKVFSRVGSLVSGGGRVASLGFLHAQDGCDTVAQ
jgi:hypothetical protein